MVQRSCMQIYSALLEKLWVLVPCRISSYIVTLTVFAFGITARGEWLLLVIHVLRQFGVLPDPNASHSQPARELSWGNISLEALRLDGFPTVWLFCNSVGFIMYFLIGGFLHWHFYVCQRARPETWKCQTTKWLPPELEMDEIRMGSVSLVVANTVTSLLACYILNGGWSSVYYRPDQHGWVWYFLQWPAIFCYQDYSTYLLHRLYHTPWLYKRFHKAHHRYLQPTAFSATAIHPVEIVHIQLVLCLPLFTVPVHWTSFTTLALYTYYNGIMDHSGVDFKAPWWQPWRPDGIFHDNHHQYFHVNFGFNCYFWDLLHGTYRRTDRIYKEDIFYGRGKPLSDASEQELKEEVAERLAENPRAHRRLNPYLDKSQILQATRENQEN